MGARIPFEDPMNDTSTASAPPQDPATQTRSKDERAAAYDLKQASIQWIASADSKATTIASILAVVLGLVSVDMAEAVRTANLQGYYWTFLGVGALTVLLCGLTLWPRTNRRRYVPNSNPSPTFFGDVPDDYESYANRVVTELDLHRDTMEQAFIVAHIAKRKMWLVRATIVMFGGTMLLLFLLAFNASKERESAGTSEARAESAEGQATPSDSAQGQAAPPAEAEAIPLGGAEPLANPSENAQ